jgi:D-3-phosphoglycerate dehydrogenase
MKVLGFDPYVGGEAMAELGIDKRDDLHGMLAASDIVSVHAVLTPGTRHLLDERALAAMKPGAVLINVSRGAIVDESALVRALAAGSLAGAGLDVYSDEPLTLASHPLSPLHRMDNVMLWPHLTFYTAEAMRRLEEETLERCFEILDGRPVLVKSRDPRLRAQRSGVRFAD